MKDDMIYNQGEVGRELYIVMEGTVGVAHADEPAHAVSHGEMFGELCLVELMAFMANKKHAAGQAPKNFVREDTATAWTDCDLKFLTLKDIQDVCSDFTTVSPALKTFYDSMLIQRKQRSLHHAKTMRNVDPENSSEESLSTEQVLHCPVACTALCVNACERI